MAKNILLLSAYDALSHRLWRQTLASLFPEFHWTQLALPARHFSWRVRGNSLSWGAGQFPELNARHDLLIATSLVDLASLRGLRPALAELPSVVYFHENQFAYPRSREQDRRGYDTGLDAALVSLYTALCADRVVFNSEHNRRTCLAGVQQLLARLPDQVPAGIPERLALARVLPVPLAMDLVAPEPERRRERGVLDVVWNHRWEYDKGPELLLQIVEAVLDRQLPIRFHILGQQFRQQPEEFAILQSLLGAAARKRPELQSQIGYIADRRDYLRQLANCDVVLSTSRHDFQGLAVLEACALGCTPLCPDSLVYPEYLDSRFLYPAAGPGSERLSRDSVLQRLQEWQQLKAGGSHLPEFNPQCFTGAALKENYLALFKEIWK
ncbi:MAG: DUF3524 domain-containing protein [Gammaproteobacteria bacterium]|nr:DUF3524 domain-containing protein [Pseudomonadales bacterium]MCP5346750.1 DUF3524 domain-containing protein [Pseudomonadales bacterium]